MATTNESIRDSFIGHQIGLLNLSRGTRRDLVEVLNESEPEIAAAIIAALASVSRRGGVNVTSVVVLNRLRSLRNRISNIRTAAFNRMKSSLRDALSELMINEVEFVSAAVESALPVVYDSVRPTTTSALSTSRLAGPGNGVRSLNDWWKSIQRADLDQMMGLISQGLINGDNPSQIAKKIIGTRSVRGTDGATQTIRNAVDTLVRTSSIHFANEAKKAWYLANSDVVKEEVYVATLDSRTTAVCRSLDGRRFAVGEGQYPPLHPNCRSLRIAVIDGEIIGLRPFKPTTERMLLEEFTSSRGLSRVGSRSDLPFGTRGDFNSFARRRVRELVGRRPASVTYGQWLREQPAWFQDDVLGKTKGALFRRGGLTLDRFVAPNNREYTIAQLRARDRQAFIDAGLDPGDFGRIAA